MKKALFLLSFLMLGAFSLTSCGGDDKDTSSKIDLTAAVNYYNSLLATMNSSDALAATIHHFGFGAGNIGEAKVKEEFAGKLEKKGGKAPGLRFIRLKTSPDWVYVLFNYVVNGSTYEIPGVGQITITNKSGNVATFTLTLYGSDDIYQGKVDLTTSTYTEKTAYLCGDWNVAHTNFVYREYKEDGKTVANTYEYNFNHGKLTVMADQLYKDHNVDIRKDIADKGDISSISFAPNSRWWINYSYGKPSCGNWAWTNEANGDFKYTWDDKDMSSTFESGTANASFDGNFAFLLLNGEGKTNAGKRYRVWVTLKMVRVATN